MFQRYIVGRANLLTMPLKLVGRHLNDVIADLDVEVCQLYLFADVWCSTDDYPAALEIDARLVTHKQPFKFSDLVLMLPDGMWLHRKYDSYRNLAIVTLGENYNILLASYNYPITNPDDPEENDINYRSFVNFDKSKTPEEAEELYKEFQSGNNDPNENPFADSLRAELGLDKSVLQEGELAREEVEIAQISGHYDDKDEELEDAEDGENFTESKINEILGEMNKRRPKPKGSLIPLAVASSKKLSQNKFDTNSPIEFKTAQKKNTGSDKKKKK